MFYAPNNYFKWFKDNIKNIVRSIGRLAVDYDDYDGSIDSIRYFEGKYFMDLYLVSDSTDTNKSISLDELLRLNSGDTFKYRYVDNNRMKYCDDPDDAIFVCAVHDLDAMAQQVFNYVKQEIELDHIS